MLFISLLFLGFLSFILFCCLAAGNDPASQALSDQEQMEFLAAWEKKHRS